MNRKEITAVLKLVLAGVCVCIVPALFAGFVCLYDNYPLATVSTAIGFFVGVWVGMGTQ